MSDASGDLAGSYYVLWLRAGVGGAWGMLLATLLVRTLPARKPITQLAARVDPEARGDRPHPIHKSDLNRETVSKSRTLMHEYASCIMRAAGQS